MKAAIALGAVLALAGCGAPPPQAERFRATKTEGTWRADNELSAAREREFGQAFIGRELVFRVVWHEYAVLDPDPDLGQPCPYRPITSSNAGTAVKVPGGTAERGHLVVAARPGDTARITGLAFVRSSLMVFARKPDGTPLFVAVDMPRGRTLLGTKMGDCTERQKIDDGNLSVAWLEDVLTRGLGELVAPPSAPARVAMPQPQQGLVLTPPPAAAAQPRARAQPGVTLLSAAAEPARLRRGDTVRLGLAFRVSGDEARRFDVEESYELSFEGKPLPRFPVRRSLQRGAGEHRSEFSQQIPQAASPGTYRFRGEVCLDGACSSRVATFEIGP